MALGLTIEKLLHERDKFYITAITPLLICQEELKKLLNSQSLS